MQFINNAASENISPNFIHEGTDLKQKDLWWKCGVIYHIYLRSFFDSNGDGIGDIQGVIQKLDYVKDLGVSGIWLSPFFKSPMADFGYDISDYLSVDSQYGSLADVRNLVDECHRRGLHIIMDIALNHTSDQHPWFVESKSSLNNPKRDWYIWKKGSRFGRPNNWITGLFESAWEYDKLTKEYYLHSFLKNQPDLNWRSPEVQEVFQKILHYWLNFGFDGFRLDMINWLIKDEKMRNNPNLFFVNIFQKQIYNKNQNNISPVLKMIRQTIDQFPNKVTIGEVFTMPPGNPELSSFYLGNGSDALNLAFDFSIMYRLWSARSLFLAVKKWLQAIPEKGWACHVLSNHDQKRSFSRLCRGKWAQEKAKVLSAFFLTIPGTPIIYYGEEIGMKSLAIRKKNIVDPLGKKFWPFYSGRDSSRTPMQWSIQKNSGFSEKNSWLPVNPDYMTINVETQDDDKQSLLNHYKELIHLRNLEPALNIGDWKINEEGQRGVVDYYRFYKDNIIRVIINFKAGKIKIRDTTKWARSLENSGASFPKSTVYWQDHTRLKWQILFSMRKEEHIEILGSGNLILYPFECLVLKKIRAT
ncbi:MAG: alpha-glucosidase [Spirochaetia bacterium]|nr:alpha-glucosidase [Spirochaetia bacterium]